MKLNLMTLASGRVLCSVGVRGREGGGRYLVAGAGGAAVRVAGGADGLAAGGRPLPLHGPQQAVVAAPAQQQALVQHRRAPTRLHLTGTAGSQVSSGHQEGQRSPGGAEVNWGQQRSRARQRVIGMRRLGFIYTRNTANRHLFL